MSGLLAASAGPGCVGAASIKVMNIHKSALQPAQCTDSSSFYVTPRRRVFSNILTDIKLFILYMFFSRRYSE